jgi:hypothetical protein
VIPTILLVLLAVIIPRLGSLALAASVPSVVVPPLAAMRVRPAWAIQPARRALLLAAAAMATLVPPVRGPGAQARAAEPSVASVEAVPQATIALMAATAAATTVADPATALEV